TMLLSGSFGPSLQKYRPYALLRDDRGNYYFVDHGTTPGDEKRFRLFLGPKGALKEQKMTNVVSDSEGDIFSTKTGSLRLILDKHETTWVQNEKKTKLVFLDPSDNHIMIYTDLGVYTGRSEERRVGKECRRRERMYQVQ